MGKTKTKSRKEIEHLRGIIRSLKKQLKNQHKDVSEDNTEYGDDDGNCPKCGKGVLTEIDLVRVKIVKCNVCDYREKINGEEKT